MNKNELITLVPDLAPLFKDKDHVDIKTIVSDQPMRTFIAGAMSYSPAWLKFLYGVRAVFVRLLGMKQESMPDAFQITPEDVSLTSGEWVSFFQVDQAKEELYWVAKAEDKHLTAYLLAVVDDSAVERQFHLVTLVKYHHWTGPVYFNVIRPFHHIVVRAMMRAGATYRYSPQPA